ncbi:methylmalonyl-CoA mutase subunit beta [Seonamhaeicola sp.]|uniref:methylmalonyl-CoA mutase subunit beta n=1 Tax=Seonamhaeicola sp. TaxID=1912245 RepID=UPI00262AC027|nr:methylmalonyl-CoA mutase subunit beta [Seonamhaeicola sp.]
MSKPLFNEFEPVSAKQWKQKIQFDLKGADYNDTLVWNTNEAIAVKPFYHSDDFKEFPPPSNTKATGWKICQTIFVTDVEKSNLKALDAIARGAENIRFIIPSEAISTDDLLKNIDLSSTPIHFELQFLSPEFSKKLAVIPAKAGIYIHNDIIGHLAKTGNWFHDLNDDFSKFRAVVNQTNSFSVDVSLYQNAGANMVQQLAYALAQANEYLNHLENNKSLNVIFKVSIGTNYFFEIAKLRALRLLWETLASEYQIHSDCHIFATPTKRNKTLYDYNTNMLRTTTECMSAILGGANTISNLPYDAIYHKDNEFGDRIARNQLLVLKHESYFDKVNNPSDGTYYIESLTNQLAEKALALFKHMEANGGFLKQLKDDTIQRKIKESAAKEQSQFDAGEEVLLGTNKHPNPNDTMKDDLELYPFVKTNPRKTLIEPVIEKRLAENIEQQRLKEEN